MVPIWILICVLIGVSGGTGIWFGTVIALLRAVTVPD
jgi:hypothetical protein